MVTIFSVFVAERHEVTIDKRRSGDRSPVPLQLSDIAPLLSCLSH